MKVLTSTNGATILTFPCFINSQAADKPEFTDAFVGLDGTAHREGKVADLPEQIVKRQVTAATKRECYEYMESREFLRDIRWIAKRLGDVENGAVITPNHRGNGYGVSVPKDARPNRHEGLKVGSLIAVGPTIRPKAFMNARGEVVAISGKKVKVKLDEGDLNRVLRDTGKKYAAVVDFPLDSVEVDAA